ncbi:DUF6932 family protein [Flavobacterium procerum]|uniref:DUF6932 family protein n=1 Tax=Flavobacterium procerum TaxID=1455569 RepID=A0ABV6BJB8_9FLAO
MLTFNNSGLLVPNHKIASTVQEFKNEFVTKIPTIQRKEIFEAYVKYNQDFKKVCNLDILHQWINGSFVTKKTNPGDIDLVTFLDYNIVLELGSKLNDFIFPNSEKIYGVDAYIIEVYPENHNNNFRYISDKAYWLDRFTKTRRIRGNRLSKGFLEIKF